MHFGEIVQVKNWSFEIQIKHICVYLLWSKIAPNILIYHRVYMQNDTTVREKNQWITVNCGYWDEKRTSNT